MQKGQIERAKRRALVIFDEWIRTTGVFHEHGSYRYEIEGITEDAVHCGAQEALGVYEKLESEQHSDDVNESDSWTEGDEQNFVETFGAFDDARP